MNWACLDRATNGSVASFACTDGDLWDTGIGETLLDIALQRRPPESIIEAIAERRTGTLQQVVTRS
jgi:hypothetical protein